MDRPVGNSCSSGIVTFWAALQDTDLSMGPTERLGRKRRNWETVRKCISYWWFCSQCTCYVPCFFRDDLKINNNILSSRLKAIISTNLLFFQRFKASTGYSLHPQNLAPLAFACQRLHSSLGRSPTVGNGWVSWSQWLSRFYDFLSKSIPKPSKAKRSCHPKSDFKHEFPARSYLAAWSRSKEDHLPKSDDGESPSNGHVFATCSKNLLLSI